MNLFALHMAWRETRAAWRHFLYFFICIALGVAAVVAVSLFGASVGTTVMREARGLMGGDLEIRLSHPLTEHGEEVLHSLNQRGIATTHVSELVAMASTGTGTGTAHAGPSPQAKSQIIELKAVAEGYPFYGTINVEPDRPLLSLLGAAACALPPDTLYPSTRDPAVPCYGAVVQESLLIRMGLRMGEPVKIGEAWFTITGILRKEPDRSASAFSLGPRVMMSQAGLLASALVKPGTRVRERYLVRLPPTTELDPLLYELRGRLAQESARVLPFRDAQPQFRRFLDQLTRYLGLIGLTALFVGGIGVASSIGAFLRDKLHTIAVLKTLGADSRVIIQTYVLQALALGGIGSLAGVFLGAALRQALPSLLKELLPVDLSDLAQPHSLWSPSSVAPLLHGLLLGVCTTLLFTIWPLLSIRKVQPALIFRGMVEPVGRQSVAADRPRLIAGLLIAIGLTGLAIWQAGTWKIGLLFMGALIAAVLSLHLGARGLIRLAATVRRPRSLAWRQAISNVYRPGSQAVGVMMSIGIGVMVILTVSLLEVALTDQLQENRPADAPTFFFIDIQPDQHAEFRRLLESFIPGARVESTPLVRSRLHALNGERLQIEETVEADQGQERERGTSWYFTREYVLTVRDRLPKDNTVIRGTWWRPGQTFPAPQVSVEEDAARHLKLQVGSTVEFDIQGTTLAAEVSSIRKVEWNNFSTNFYMILSPGSLDGAPMTYVATIRVPPEREVSLQQAVVAAFPNVTAINIRDVMDTFVQMLERLAMAIRAVALFCILTSAMVMAGALAATRYRRLYESVIFKALGATRGLIARTFAAEYALLGAAAGLIGVLLASVLSWALLTYILDLSWAVHVHVMAAGFLLTILLTVAVGFLSTFRILGHPPLSVLRQE